MVSMASCVAVVAHQRVVEVGVEAARRAQLVVAPALDDATLVDDHDLIGVDDRRQAVRDDDGGAIGEGVGQRPLHQRLVFAVEVTRGFVEHDDGGIFDQHAGDREPLLFAARQPVAALADDGVVAVGQRRR